jgi:hypothetical protein
MPFVKISQFSIDGCNVAALVWPSVSISAGRDPGSLTQSIWSFMPGLCHFMLGRGANCHLVFSRVTSDSGQAGRFRLFSRVSFSGQIMLY